MKPSKVDAIGFLMLVCFAGLGYLLLIHQPNQRLSSVKQQIAELTRITLANEGLENVLEQDRAELKPLQEKLEEYTNSFANRKELDLFLQRFASQAQSAGVSVNLIRPGEVGKEAWYEFTPISVDLEGAFDGIYRLVRVLETGGAMTTVASLKVLSEPGRATCRATLVFKLYLKSSGGA